MICSHGFSEETCPHCRMQIGIKPPIQLVKSPVKELPIPVPNEDNLINRKDLQYHKLHQSNNLISNMPQRLTRNFNLGNSVRKSNPSLFQQRMNQLNSKHDPKNLLSCIKIEESIIDIGQKFVEKKQNKT